jgi:acetyltransferase
MNSGRGLRFSYVVSSGNEAVTTAEDLLAFFIEDPSTSLILAFIEGFRRPRRLIELGRQAMAAGKPVIVLKTGMTQRSSQIARSHSGALAGSAEAHIAALDEAGIIRVDDFDEMVETAVLLSHVTERPASARTAIFTNSGGETGLTADVAAATGLDIASYSPATTERLQQVLELAGDVLPTNPLDSGMGFASSAPFRDRLRTALQLYDADPGVDVIVFGIDLNKRTSPAAGASDGLEVVRQEALRGRKVFTVLSHLTSGGVDDEVAAGVRSAGVPVLLGTRQGLLAIRHLGEYGQSRLMPSPGSGANPERAGAFIPAVPAGAVLGELALAPLLREYGIPQAAASLATSAEQAVAIAGQIGYPVVLKIVSADVVHKSRAGGVRVGLTSEAAVAESFQSIIDAISASSPQARLNGVLVARQYPPGPEFLLGARADRDFGPVIIFGRGGTQVEELRTFSVAMAPLTEDRVYRLYQQVATGKAAHSSPDSDGQFRDLLPILVRFGQLAADSESLYDELEINPLLVAATGPIALDARMVLSAGAGERDAGGEGLRD